MKTKCYFEKLAFIIISFGTFFGVTETYCAEPENRDLPARSVALELNKVENSFGYDVQIRPFSQHWAKPYSFHLEDEHLHLRLTPGEYQVHTRSYFQSGVPGRWSHWQSFSIQFRASEVSFPASGAKIEPMGDKLEKITFEWKKVPSANGYAFKLKNSHGEIIKQVDTTDTWFSAEISVDSKYSWQVVPTMDKDVQPSELEFPFTEFTVLPPGEGMRSMVFEVAGNKKAVKYQFEFVRLAEKSSETSPSIFDSREPNFKMRLRPGDYELRARSLDKNDVLSDWSSPQKFHVDFAVPAVLLPREGEAVEASDDKEAEVVLRWQKIPDVHLYQIYVFDKAGTLVLSKPVETNETKVILHHNSDYKWKVVACSLEEPNRHPASVEDKDVNSFHLNKFEIVDLNAAEEPSAWYGWLRTTSSMISYLGQNFDNDTLVNEQVFANAAELAGGVWIRKTSFGALVSGTLSGYRTSSQSFFYENLGVSAGYRHIYDEKNRLRLWLGYYYRQLPEILSSPVQSSYSIVGLADSGPQFQTAFTHSFNEKWGWQTYGILYYGLTNQGTPNSLSSIPQFSYQAGLSLTYKLSQSFTGMIGYTYKDEHASYNSSDRTGNPNVIDYSGHYLNLTLEFGMSKPYSADAE